MMVVGDSTVVGKPLPPPMLEAGGDRISPPCRDTADGERVRCTNPASTLAPTPPPPRGGAARLPLRARDDLPADMSASSRADTVAP